MPGRRPLADDHDGTAQPGLGDQAAEQASQPAWPQSASLPRGEHRSQSRSSWSRRRSGRQSITISFAGPAVNREPQSQFLRAAAEQLPPGAEIFNDAHALCPAAVMDRVCPASPRPARYRTVRFRRSSSAFEQADAEGDEHRQRQR